MPEKQAGWRSKEKGTAASSGATLKITFLTQRLFAGWQKGFSVWSQSGHRPQRASPIPAAFPSSERTKPSALATPFNTSAPDPCAHPRPPLLFFNPFVSHLSGLLLLSIDNSPPPPLLLLFLLTFYSPSVCSFFFFSPHMWPSWHLTYMKSYLWLMGVEIKSTSFFIKYL